MAIKPLMIGVVFIFILTIHVECIRKNNARLSGGVNSQRHSRPFQFEESCDACPGSNRRSPEERQRFEPMDCFKPCTIMMKPAKLVKKYRYALILRVGSEGEAGFCGGALVHRQWVLTAAHCCFHAGELITHGQAVLGAHSLYDRFENGRRMINVEQIVIHPDYDALTFANDLALLKLANIAQISDTIDTIRLPYLDTVTWSFTGTSATASGWGIAAEGVTFISPTLREKPMIVIADELCNTTFSEQLSDSTVCTYSSSGGGTCKGDNGGPLTLLFNRSEELILLGVASFVAAGGCNSAMPSVFTRVQRYLPWISDVTGIALD